MKFIYRVIFVCTIAIFSRTVQSNDIEHEVSIVVPKENQNVSDLINDTSHQNLHVSFDNNDGRWILEDETKFKSLIPIESGSYITFENKSSKNLLSLVVANSDYKLIGRNGVQMINETILEDESISTRLDIEPKSTLTISMQPNFDLNMIIPIVLISNRNKEISVILGPTKKDDTPLTQSTVGLIKIDLPKSINSINSKIDSLGSFINQRTTLNLTNVNNVTTMNFDKFVFVQERNIINSSKYWTKKITLAPKEIIRVITLERTSVNYEK